MKRKDSTGIKFNKTLFCLYQSTSDDLMFWCWFDVLILSMNYGFDMTQISLLFTVSFWVALILKFPAGFMAKKLGAGRSVLLSALLFLNSSASSYLRQYSFCGHIRTEHLSDCRKLSGNVYCNCKERRQKRSR